MITPSKPLPRLGMLLLAAVLVGVGWLAMEERRSPREREIATSRDKADVGLPKPGENASVPSEPGREPEAASLLWRFEAEVVSETGEPVSGAVVSLYYNAEVFANGRRLAQSKTDERGSCSVEWDPGTRASAVELDRVVVLAHAKGYQPLEHQLEAGQLQVGATLSERLVLRAGIPVVGRVRTPTNEAPESGVVVLRWVFGRELGVFRPPILLDPEGRFEAAVPKDTAEVTAFACVPKFGPASKWHEVKDSAVPAFEIKLSSSSTVSGRVLSYEDAPAPGAEIYVDYGEKGDLPLAISDASGYFEFQLDTWLEEEDLEVRGPEWLPTTACVRFDEPLTIRVQPARWLVARFSEEVESPKIRPNHGRTDFVAEQDRFVAGGLEARSSSGVIFVEGFLPIPVSWPRGTGEHDLGLLELNPGIELTVQVTSPQGSPIPNAKIRLMDLHYRKSYVLTTDGEGTASQPGLPSGEIVLAVLAQGYRDSIRGLHPRESKSFLAVEMIPEALIEGRVVDERGEPVSDTHVGSPRQWVFSGPTHDNSFSIEVPPNEKIVLEFEHHDYLKTAVTVLTPAPGTTLTIGDVVLERGVRVSGVVTTQSYAPIQDAIIEVLGDTRFTGEEGDFELAPLRPGKVKILCDAEGFQSHEEEILIADVPNHEIQVVLEPATRQMGQVLLSDGSPASETKVSWEFLQRPGPNRNGTSETDDEGVFWIPSPRDEPIRLHLDHLGISREVRLQTPRELDTPITLPQGGELRIDGSERMSDADLDFRLKTHGNSFYRDLECDSNGVAWVKSVGPGTHEVRLTTDFMSGFVTQSVEIRAGETSTVTLDTSERPPLRISITDRQGVPIAGARVVFEQNQALSDLEGQVELDATSDSGCLLIDAPLFANRRLELAPRHDATATLPGQIHVMLAPESRVSLTLEGWETDDLWIDLILQEVAGLCGSTRTTFAALQRSRSGLWEATGLPAGEYELLVIDGDAFDPKNPESGMLTRKVLNLAEGEHLHETVTVPEPMKLRIHVTVGGRVVEDLRLQIDGGETRAESPGHFSATLFERRTHDFVVTGDGLSHVERRMVTSSGSIDIDVPQRKLSITCLDPSGDSVGPATLYLGRKQGAEDEIELSSHGRGVATIESPGWYRWQLDPAPNGSIGHGKVKISEQTDSLVIQLRKAGRLLLEGVAPSERLNVFLERPSSSNRHPFVSFSGFAPEIYLPVGSRKLWFLRAAQDDIDRFEAFATATVNLNPEGETRVRLQWHELASVEVVLPNGWDADHGVVDRSQVKATLRHTSEAGEAFHLQLRDNVVLFAASPGEAVLRLEYRGNVLFEQPITILNNENRIRLDPSGR